MPYISRSEIKMIEDRVDTLLKEIRNTFIPAGTLTVLKLQALGIQDITKLLRERENND